MRIKAFPLALGVASLLGALAACGGTGDSPEQSNQRHHRQRRRWQHQLHSATARLGRRRRGHHASTTTGSGGTGGIPLPPHEWVECQASDQAFVRKAILAVGGRRAWGQAEINAYVDAIAGMRQADGGVMPAPGSTELETPKKLVVEALMRESAFREALE
jgi:hypothetical protein